MDELLLLSLCCILLSFTLVFINAQNREYTTESHTVNTNGWHFEAIAIALVAAVDVVVCFFLFFFLFNKLFSSIVFFFYFIVIQRARAHEICRHTNYLFGH